MNIKNVEQYKELNTRCIFGILLTDGNCFDAQWPLSTLLPFLDFRLRTLYFKHN